MRKLQLGSLVGSPGTHKKEEEANTFLHFFCLSHLGPVIAQFSSVQFSRVQILANPWTSARQASLSIINSIIIQTHVHWVCDAIQPFHPLSSPSLPAFNLSQHQGLFIWVSSSHQVAKILEFQLQHQSFQWHPGQISFRMDWLDLLAVQGILKSLLQHHSSEASILLCSAFFTVQLSHLHMNIGKTIALTRWTFVDKVMPLLFNMLSRLVITFLPRSSVQWLRHARLFVTPWTTARQTSLSITNWGVHPNPCPLSWWCHPTISLCHPLLPLPSTWRSIRIFSNESALRIR